MQAVVDAIRKGDGDAAAKACLAHVESAAVLADRLIRDMESAERLAAAV
jgi:DNA-binding GntR family transcriptional regulator